MNRKTSRFRTLRGSSAHKHGPAAMKPGPFYPHRRRLRPGRWVRVLQALPATLALIAAALLPASCEPPASPLPAAPSSPSPAALEVPRISGLPNMAQIEQRLNAQYAESAESTEGKVEFTPPSISGITVSAAITYADDQLLEMKIGDKDYEIKTITITREVDGKTIPTRVEYKDKPGTTRKTITSRYVPANVPTNNVQQSLEGGPRFSEAAAEGHTLHISGEERDGDDNILRTFTAAERTGGGTTTLQTTYSRPDKEGFTETVTTENGIPSRKEVTYPDKDAAAQKIKTKTITYEKSASAMFYPARQKLTLAVYRDAEGEETKRDEAQDDGSMLTTMRDKSTITTTTSKDNVTLAVYKDADGNTTETIETTPIENGTRAVHKNPDGTEIQHVETRSDGSTITTKTTAEGTTKALVIHPSVTAIEDKAFRNSGLTSLTMGNNLQTIGEHAFHNNELTSLTIGNSVKTIGRGAFWNNKLTSLTIGNGVKTIGYGAFANNPALKTVRITGTGAIENNAFYYYETTHSTNGIFRQSGSSGIELVIEDGITSIGDTAFSMNELTSVTIPPSVISIGWGAFSYNQLTSVTTPPSVTSIGNTAFAGNQLTSLTMGNGVKTIGSEVFRSNQLTSLTIPPSVTSIGEAAFRNNKLTELTIGNSLQTIETEVFRDNQLYSVTIPPSVTSIGGGAFRNNKLTIVEIPPSVTAIGRWAFSYNQLTSLTIPPSVNKIHHAAFYKNQLASVSIPASIGSIGKTAFDRNDPLKIVRITGTGAITTKAFTYLDLADPQSEIKGIFRRADSGDITLIIGDGITSIGDSAFAKSYLTSVVIGKNVRTIGSKAFERNKLTTVVIPSSVTAIGQGAFSDNKLTSVILPEALSKARETAFNGNPAGLQFRDHKGRELGTN